jgi:filamentous hemagglutinin family protein
MEPSMNTLRHFAAIIPAHLWTIFRRPYRDYMALLKMIQIWTTLRLRNALDYSLTVPMRKTIFVLCFFQAFGNPTDPVVMLGEATFHEPAPKMLHITTGDQTILNWGDFSIGIDELTKFIQPSETSTVINKVITGNPSALLGRLEANGTVYLINPNGILVGENAVINTANFMAFITDVPPEMCLKGADGKIPIFIQPLEGETNTNPYALAIQHKGKIDALGTREEGGRVYLFAGTGNVDVSGTIVAGSGDVQVFGDHVVLSEQAKIDVSGDFGGGSVKIGNTYGSQTAISPDSVICADARMDGNGGEVLVWSEEATRFFGTISAQGGSLGGDGGFVEISSPKFLDFQGIVDASAPNGKMGRLLLDPADVTINAVGPILNWDPTCPTGFIGNPANVVILNTALQTALLTCSVTIDTSTSTAASVGDISVVAPVVWATANSLSLAASRDLTIEEQIQCTGSGSISVAAIRDVNIGSPTANTAFVTQALSELNTNSGTINVAAGRNLTLRAGTQAAITPSPASITSTTGAINLAVDGETQLFGSQNGIAVAGAFARITTGQSVSLINYGNLTLVGSSGSSGPAEINPSGNLSMNVGGDVSLTGGLTSAVASPANINAGDNLTAYVTGGISITAQGLSGASISGATSATIYAASFTTTGTPLAMATLAASSGNLLLTTRGAINLNQDSSVTHGLTGNLQLIAGTNLILLGNAVITTNSSQGITLVVDNLFSSPPGIGPGYFYLDTQASVFPNIAVGGPLRIFTARQSQNTVLGLLKNARFVPGTEFVDTDQERWGIYYPNSFGGFPLTFFYKNILFPDNLITDFNIAMYEFLQGLFDYDILDFYPLPFSLAYNMDAYKQKPKTLSSYDVIGERGYRILKKTYREHNGKIKNIL